MNKSMKRPGGSALAAIFLIIPVICLATKVKQESFSPYVNEKGNLTPPPDYRSSWVHLGNWVVTSQAAAGPDQGGISHANGFHEAYAQPDSLRAYKATGRWPDGAVLILEVRPVLWDDLPTGHVMYAGDETETAVMIKDGRGRFKDHPNWGGGWGWALFKAGEPQKNISRDHKVDCLRCHEVAGDSDFVFVQGYPVLR